MMSDDNTEDDDETRKEFIAVFPIELASTLEMKAVLNPMSTEWMNNVTLVDFSTTVLTNHYLKVVKSMKVYAAASDTETYAPEGFEKFFNQRRRWTPSCIANTVDLLMDYEGASAKKDAISYAVILLIIFFSMLGPAISFSQCSCFGKYMSIAYAFIILDVLVVTSSQIVLERLLLNS
ncbi:hypothetical protein CRE_31333 [Caenorhabditis remanei]|uniref:Chitin synthase n=1 Tax=Caenorhabditis remanei TaxID=31234 RepID=E3MY87_CAERE|nr:hypothetical protein CRE_31333 [Caenorhabditis remanei]